MTTSLLQHVRIYLGEPAGKYRVRLPVGAELIIYEFANQPCEDATTLITDGLVDCPAHLAQELIVCVYSRWVDNELPKLLAAVANQAVDSQLLFQRGDVLGPAGPLLSTTTMSALYVTHPVYFPSGFSQFCVDGGCASLMWLVPIYESEAATVASSGWDSFESQLELQDPDLLDLQRDPIELRAWGSGE
jgi:hypothetical protein